MPQPPAAGAAAAATALPAADPSEPPPPSRVGRAGPSRPVARSSVTPSPASATSTLDAPRTRHRYFVLEPGDEIDVTTVSVNGDEGVAAGPATASIVTGYFKSEMSEYDGNYVFVPLDYLQQLRVMDDRVTSIQISLTDYDATPRQW